MSHLTIRTDHKSGLLTLFEDKGPESKQCVLGAVSTPGLARFLVRPPMIKLETVNVCNAKCAFCLYKDRTPQKALMDEALFDLMSRQISAVGTEQVCVAPMLGDPLLDDRTAGHVARLKRLGNIRVIRLVTNGIALDRHSDEQLIELFSALDSLQISLGPNRDVYRRMFGVDRFEHLISQLERVCGLMELAPRKPGLVRLAGRACGADFTVDSRLSALAQRLCGQADIDWTRKYKDWGGAIRNLPLSTSVIRTDNRTTASVPCYYALTPHIYHDGRVGLCSCAGVDDSLLIGDLRTHSWEEILCSSQRIEMISSFLDGSMPEYCSKCSFYWHATKIDWTPIAKFLARSKREG